MKKCYLRYFALLSAFFLVTSLTNAQTFVNAAATGANDGTSWADAYSDLGTAITNTTAGEVWVAAGNYHPGVDTSATFLISNPITLLGGFAGTETMASERDFTANATILSGDLNEDDTPDDFVTNKSDNVRRIVVIDSMNTGLTTIDGFIITKGFGNVNANDETLDSGAGLFAYRPVTVNNCTFTQNAASTGSSIYLSPQTGAGSTAGTIIESCTFSNNMAVDAAAGVYIVAQTDITANNCTFTNNITNRGVFYPVVSADIELTNSIFDGNSNPTGAGGAVWNWNTIGFNITNVQFTNNTATTASAIYYDGRNSDVVDINDMVLTDCVFQGNESTDGVAAFWSSKGNFTMNNVDFIDNTAGSGAHMMITGDVLDASLTDCSFSGGAAGRSGVFEVFSDTTTLTFTDCDFENNVSGTIAGVMLLSDSAVVNMTGCDFTSNSASTDAGVAWTQAAVTLNMTDCDISSNTAMEDFGVGILLGAGLNMDDCLVDGNIGVSANAFSIQGDGAYGNFLNSTISDNGNDLSEFGGSISFLSGDLTVDSCVFSGNRGMRGGAIYCQGIGEVVNITNTEFSSNSSDIGGGVELSGGNTYNVENCLFEGNSSDRGGALGTILFDSNNNPVLNIDKCTFESNVSEVQGGAINISDTKELTITNSLFSNNINIFQGAAGEGGAGGAISLNAGDTIDLNVLMAHNTLVNNESIIGLGVIASFTTDLSSTLNLTMQNNIMDNPDSDDYVIEAGTPVLTSLGGNLSTDDSGVGNGLDHAADLNEVDDILFVSANDYAVTENSPAVGAGTSSTITEDITGFTRLDPPTSGAFEFDPSTISVKETVVPNAGQLKVLPNPVNEVLTFELTNEWKGDMEVRIYNIEGKLLNNFKVNKGEEVLLQSTNVSNYANGIYDIVISDSNQAIVTKFVKL